METAWPKIWSPQTSRIDAYEGGWQVLSLLPDLHTENVELIMLMIAELTTVDFRQCEDLNLWTLNWLSTMMAMPEQIVNLTINCKLIFLTKFIYIIFQDSMKTACCQGHSQTQFQE